MAVRPLNTDRRAAFDRRSTSERRANRVVDTELDDVSVRPARMDRPLRQANLDPTYTDPHLEELVRVAAERARNEAQAEGYAAGWSQGRQAAAIKAQTENATLAQQIASERAIAGQRMAQLLAALSETAKSAKAAVAPDWSEVADTLADGALRLAAAALGRELRSIDDAVVQAVKGALQRLADPSEAVVHLNPEDAALVVENDDLGVKVISDPRVSVGSVIVLTPAQQLRHDLPAALNAAEEVLRS
jgi:flagellar assembly protein FliH